MPRTSDVALVRWQFMRGKRIAIAVTRLTSATPGLLRRERRGEIAGCALVIESGSSADALRLRVGKHAC